jgi:hypothetical protein
LSLVTGTHSSGWNVATAVFADSCPEEATGGHRFNISTPVAVARIYDQKSPIFNLPAAAKRKKKKRSRR